MTSRASAKHSTAPTAPGPTEDEPNVGYIKSEEGVVLSRAEHFVLDNVHTIRSLEYNVSSHADSFDEAVDQFEEDAEHYFQFLVRRAHEQGLAEHERDELRVLQERFFAVYDERNKELVGALRRQVLRLLPLGRRPGPTWHQRLTQETSSTPSSD